MKYKKNIITIYLMVVFIFAVFFFTVGEQKVWADNEKDIFDRARLAMFDRQWDRALKELDLLTEMYPDTAYYSQVMFYKGKSWKEKKRSRKALEYFEAFLKTSTNETLKEEALGSIIDLSFQLYQQGNRGSIRRVVKLLKSDQPMVQYYAAFKLSYVKNKSTASKAVKILKKIIRQDDDDALVDRAKIALMRIDPQHLRNVPETKSLENSMLVIRIVNKRSKKEVFSFSIPFALAKLALDAIPNEERKNLEAEGHNLDKLLQTVAKTRKFIRIEGGDSIFEIGIK
jgi:tetratricopeptide (TPR) repeat protein